MNTEKSSLSLKIVLRLVVLALLVLTLRTLTGFAEERRAIKFPGTASLPFSDGVIAGNTLYVAGQEGTDDQANSRPAESAPKRQAALANIENRSRRPVST